MFVTFITDCGDDNAVSRVETRSASLLKSNVSSVRVTGDLGKVGELEAAGNLIDMLDASETRRGVIMLNIAPRHGDRGDRWDNGSPFCYFFYGETLVLSTIDGLVLSLVKKLGIVEKVSVLDIEKTVSLYLDKSNISYPADWIAESQFRGFDFLPRVAAHILEGGEVESGEETLSFEPYIENKVWWIDNFGNIKTTMIREDIIHRPAEVIETNYGPLSYRYSLSDVDDGDAALIAGSSGMLDKRFLEIVVQGGSAADKFNARVGDVVLRRR